MYKFFQTFPFQFFRIQSALNRIFLEHPWCTIQVIVSVDHEENVWMHFVNSKLLFLRIFFHQTFAFSNLSPMLDYLIQNFVANNSLGFDRKCFIYYLFQLWFFYYFYDYLSQILQTIYFNQIHLYFIIC